MNICKISRSPNKNTTETKMHSQKSTGLKSRPWKVDANLRLKTNTSIFANRSIRRAFWLYVLQWNIQEQAKYSGTMSRKLLHPARTRPESSYDLSKSRKVEWIMKLKAFSRIVLTETERARKLILGVQLHYLPAVLCAGHIAWRNALRPINYKMLYLEFII